MQTVLEQAIEELKAMPPAAQDAIAHDLLDMIRSERKWGRLFEDPRSETLFERMANKVRADVAAGRVTAGDPGYARQMKSQTNSDFWDCFKLLPADERDRARNPSVVAGQSQPQPAALQARQQEVPDLIG
jgi:hypothetical protein